MDARMLQGQDPMPSSEMGMRYKSGTWFLKALASERLP